jgi:cysteinyl-tRNA synthetase
MLEKAQQKFEAGLNDDLNTSVALAAVFDLMREVNAAIDHNQLRSENQKKLLALIDKFDTVLGVLGEDTEQMLEEEIVRLIEERNQARKSRNFARSDEIRDQLAAGGILLEDTKDGVRWRRK